MLPFLSNGFQPRKPAQFAAVTVPASSFTNCIPCGIYLPFVVCDLAGQYIRDWLELPSLRGAGSLANLRIAAVSESISGSYIVMAQGRKVVLKDKNTLEIFKVFNLLNTVPSNPTQGRAPKLTPDDQFLFVPLAAAPWYQIFRVSDGVDVSNLLTPSANRPTQVIVAFDFNPVNGDLAIITNNTPNLRIFNSDFTFKNPQPNSVIVANTGSCKYSPDGSLLAVTGSSTVPIRLYDVLDYQLRATPSLGFANPVVTAYNLTWFSDSQRVLATKLFQAVNTPFSLYSLDVTTNVLSHLIGLDVGHSNIGTVGLIKNESILLVGRSSASQGPRFFSTTTWTEIPSSSRANGLAGTNCLSFVESPGVGEVNGDSIITEAGTGGMCEFEYLVYDNLISRYTETPLNLAPEAISTDRYLSKIAFGYGRASIGKFFAVFDSRTGKKKFYKSRRSTLALGGVLGIRPVLNPSGSHVVCFSEDILTALTVYDADTGNVLRALPLPALATFTSSRQHEYSIDGRYLIALYWNGNTTNSTARTWLCVYDSESNYDLVVTHEFPLGHYAQRFSVNPLNNNVCIDWINSPAGQRRPILYDNFINMNVVVNLQFNPNTFDNQAGVFFNGGSLLLVGNSVFDALNSYAFVTQYSELANNAFANNSTGLPNPDPYARFHAYHSALAGATNPMNVVDPRTRTATVRRVRTEANHVFSNLAMTNKNTVISDLHLY